LSAPNFTRASASRRGAATTLQRGASPNPVGAPLAHAALHVTAVAHSYDMDTFLPPHAVGR
jgi:hypothetical protein